MDFAKGDGFTMSYNPDTRDGWLGDKDGGPETALRMTNMPCGKDGHMWIGDHFYILKGDFRNDYEAIVADGGGKWDCKWFYDQHKKQYGSRWSTDFHEWGRDGVRRKRIQRTPDMATKAVGPHTDSHGKEAAPRIGSVVRPGAEETER